MASISEKSGMEKINESMEKIGAMLGVQPSNDSDDSKKETLIKKESPVIAAANSAEGNVVSPPAASRDEASLGGASYKTKPTTPGKTKTPVGAAVAGFAARLDNVANSFNKRSANIATAACGGGDAETGYKRSSNDTVDSADYYSNDKAPGASCPTWAKQAGFCTLAAVVVLGIVSAVPGTTLNSYFKGAKDDAVASKDQEMSVAFIGNSYMYINDVPRVMEAISSEKISQQSVINTGAGLGSILKQGNGMYELWQTQNSLGYWETFDFQKLMENTNIEVDEDYMLYDFGMCTVPQLLEGYDGYLSYQNNNEVYFDVGTNPCFEDEYYMTIIQQASFQEPMYFDYVVMNDQTRRIANYEARQDSIAALTQAYAPLIKASRAVPVIVDTHAYFFSDDGTYTNETMGGIFIGSSIGAFTSAIYEGVYQYVDALEANLPSKQAPKIAKVGMTYLAIHEDSETQWAKLFSADGIHASQLGTYLQACVLYATMYGHLPAAIHSDYDMRALFFKSRALYGDVDATPTVAQAEYVRSMVTKVVLHKYVPKTMVLPVREEAVEESEWQAEYEADMQSDYDQYQGQGQN